MCSVLDLARAYRMEDLQLIEIMDCVKTLLRYQSEIAKMQFSVSVVLEVDDSRFRKKRALHVIDEHGEKMYRIVQNSVARLNELAALKGLGMILNVTEVITKESITQFCARTAYELATGELLYPHDPAPASVMVLAA